MAASLNRKPWRARGFYLVMAAATLVGVIISLLHINLLEVCRYVDLNPVRARLVRKREASAWWSYRAHVGPTPAPAWLDTEDLHGYLLGQAVRAAADRRRPADRYARLVASVPHASLWDNALRQ